MKKLSKQMAEDMITKNNFDELSNFKLFHFEALELLVKHSWYGPTEHLFLDLSGIEVLDIKTAKILSSHIGHLKLGITKLENSIFEYISKIGGRLILDSVNEINHTSIKGVENHYGPLLSLDAITFIDQSIAKELAKHRGASISLEGITQMELAAQNELANYKGLLILNQILKNNISSDYLKNKLA
jgi:hypothetical protein